MLLVSESERCIITPLHQKDIHHWSKVENENKKRIVLIIIAIIIAALLFAVTINLSFRQTQSITTMYQ